jgi:hypothetical protein
VELGQHVWPEGHSKGSSLHGVGVAAPPLPDEDEHAPASAVKPRAATTSEKEARSIEGLLAMWTGAVRDRQQLPNHRATPTIGPLPAQA